MKKDGTTVSKYEYDQNGNRTKYIANGDTTLAVYDDQDRLLSYGNYNYTYDKNGNLTSKYSVLDTTY
ncbi:MAG: hypothetical protein GXX85_07645, partial [Ignavibacteria bacterium]|nr:hypothetical protein [Ignavibacteria bacterium]